VRPSFKSERTNILVVSGFIKERDRWILGLLNAGISGNLEITSAIKTDADFFRIL
jgi:hypothetical protein